MYSSMNDGTSYDSTIINVSVGCHGVFGIFRNKL